MRIRFERRAGAVPNRHQSIVSHAARTLPKPKTEKLKPKTGNRKPNSEKPSTTVAPQKPNASIYEKAQRRSTHVAGPHSMHCAENGTTITQTTEDLAFMRNNDVGLDILWRNLASDPWQQFSVTLS